MKESARQYSPWSYLGFIPISLLTAAYVFVFVRRRVFIRWTPADYYPRLAEAFLDGHLDLRGTLHVTDLSFFDGKWFLYWGPMPSVWIMPFRAWFSYWCTGQMVGAALGVLSIGIWLSILNKMNHQRLVTFSPAHRVYLALFAVAGTNVHSLCVMGSIWELSHAFTYFYITLAIRFALNRTLRSAMISGLFFGCAVLTRLSMALLIPIAFYVLARSVVSGPLWQRQHYKRLLAIATPFFAALATQGIYNYYRFHSFLETGFRYQNDRSIYRGRYEAFGLVSPRYFVENFKLYFLRPFNYEGPFPYLNPNSTGNSFWSYEFAVFIPLLAVALWLISAKNRRQKIPSESRAILTACFTTWFIYLLFLLFLYTSGAETFGNRYLVDVLPMLILIIFLSLERLRSSILARLIAFALVSASFVPQILFRFYHPLS